MPVRSRAPAGMPRTRNVSDTSSMRTLARRTNLRRRCATAPASSRGSTANNSSAAARNSASSAIDAALRVVQAGERGCADAELLDVGRKLALQESRGVGAAKRQHAQSIGRARQIDASGSAHLCFCRGFIWSDAADSGRIRARAECPFRRRFPSASAAVPAPAHVQTPCRPPQPRCPPKSAGPPGPEPTRFGDWEKNGRCVDF